MKRLVFLLALALVLMPALALAQVAEVDCVRPAATDFVDVKAYGDQSAEYGTGVMLVDPGHEEGFACTTEKSVAVNITTFCAENNAPGCWSDCGMNVGQLKFDASCTDTHTFTTFDNDFSSYSSSGMANMSSLAGVSMCATNASGSGCLFQTQTVNQNSGGLATTANYCPPSFAVMGASSCYTGTQTIALHVDNYNCP